MVKSKEMTPAVRAQLMALYEEGAKVKMIAEKIGFSPSSIYYNIKKCKEDKSFERRKVCGRKPALTKSDVQYLKLCSLRARGKTVSELRDELNFQKQKPVGLTTVRTTLKQCGVVAGVACRKPLLSQLNTKKRLLKVKMSATRVAVVTGSNKGIGFGIVKELCSKFDGDVFLTSRDVTRGNAAVDELNKLGLHPKFHQLDIDDEASITALRDYLQSTYGGLDVLVNNAGIASKSTATESFGEQAVMTLRTNFFSNLKACQILFPILRAHARVVNVSSCMGHMSKLTGDEKAALSLKEQLSSPNLSVEELSKMMNDFIISAGKGDHQSFGWPNSTYSVSKIGLSALTRIQQRQFDKDIREDLIVNSVHPGWVDTDMTSHKGPLKIEEGAVAPSWLALLPKNVEGPKGGYVWFDKQIVDWVEGPLPSDY